MSTSMIDKLTIFLVIGSFVIVRVCVGFLMTDFFCNMRVPNDEHVPAVTVICEDGFREALCGDRLPRVFATAILQRVTQDSALKDAASERLTRRGPMSVP